MLDCRILVREFKVQSPYYAHLRTNNLYPPSYGANSTITFHLEEWIWYEIIQESWYTIKHFETMINLKTVSAPKCWAWNCWCQYNLVRKVCSWSRILNCKTTQNCLIMFRCLCYLFILWRQIKIKDPRMSNHFKSVWELVPSNTVIIKRGVYLFARVKTGRSGTWSLVE